MELNIETKQQLEQLLVKPNSVKQEHIPFLQQLIKTFPYYQPLHLLLAKASSETENKQNTFAKAALYTNGSILHRIIHDQILEASENINLVTYEPWSRNHADGAVSHEASNSNLDPTSAPSITIEEAPIIENSTPSDSIVEVENTEPHKEEIIITNPQNFVVPEIENLEPLQSEIIKVYEPEQISIAAPEADEQEVFEEINEFIAPPEDNLKQEVAAIEIQEEVPFVNEIETSEQDTPQEEELIIETVAATDFFAFDRSLNTEKPVEQEVKANTTFKTSIDYVKENIVSKYDDDQLPFTFLWWLAKTRKDHDQIFRPFASPVTANTQPLQQQYVEHIFHLQAPLEPIEEEATTLPATKGNEIIENFIKNDPQIKALKPDQINNENKAKRSAEDTNDVVSETLAQIYIEQMLYHKAIDTYQKLSLKFPEKSGYFADLIQSLEKKI